MTIGLAAACAGQTGPEPWASEVGLKLGPNDRPSWCGFFVRTIWRREGREVPDWTIGSANVDYLIKTSAPLDGDLVCFRGLLGHQALFDRFDGDYVWTWDGNTVDPVTGVSGTIARRRRPISEVAAYYEAPPLIADTVPPTSDPEPAVIDEPEDPPQDDWATQTDAVRR